MKKWLFSLFAVSQILTVHSAKAAISSLSNLFVFCDSVCDGGNGGLLSSTPLGSYPPGTFPPPPYVGGRASNGPTAVEDLWNRFNRGDNSFRPSLAGGTNYAVLGATSGTANSVSVDPNFLKDFSLLEQDFASKGNAWQLQQFLATRPGSFDRATSLFVVWFLGNDLAYSDRTGTLPGSLNDTLPTPFPATAPPAPEVVIANWLGNIVATVTLLESAGARHFIVPNLPDLGLTPYYISQGPEISQAVSLLSEQFNFALSDTLSLLADALPEADIIPFQTDDLFSRILADPQKYGLDPAKTDQACISDALCAEDPAIAQTYLFWDGNHPTAAGHAILGRAFYNSVRTPTAVPGPLPLAGGIAAFGWSRRLRRRLRLAQGSSPAAPASGPRGEG